MTNYNQQAPAVGRKQMWRTISIGWVHEVDGDDIVIVEDEEGNPIARTYRVPSSLTSRQLIDAVEKVGQKRLDELARSGTMDAAVELLGAVIGDNVVMDIANDPTVEANAFADFMTDLIEQLGLDEAVPGGADPKV